jgi:hypothetical protein
MRLSRSLPAAVRLRIAVGFAAVLLLLTGCAPAAPADQIPGGPAAVTHSVSPSVSPSVSASPDATSAATTAPPAAPAAPPPAPAPKANATTANGSGGGGCAADEYRNVDGNCVPRPTQAAAPPAGATAECNDGTYSFSQHRSGTCSHHGGVKRWL